VAACITKADGSVYRLHLARQSLALETLEMIIQRIQRGKFLLLWNNGLIREMCKNEFSVWFKS
jgi:hypothetical protein